MMTQPSRAGFVAVLGLLCLTTGATRAADEPRIKTDRDIVYTKAGGTELKVDIARPAEGEGPFPAVFVIHGGAWRSGNKSHMGGLIDEFARHGYVAVSPQYRFCPKEVFPAQVHDVKAAVRWLKANARTYRVDPERVGAIGFSAGGHLALMLGVTGPKDGLEGGAAEDAPDTRIKAVVNYFGPTELGAKDIPNRSKPLVRDFLGATPEEKPDLASRASPLTYVSPDDPPILTFQGTKDPLVPFTQAIVLTEAMTEKGVPGRVELMIGSSHGWAGAELKHTMEESYRFLDQYLNPAASSKTTP